MLLILTGKTASGKDTVIGEILKKNPLFGKVLTTTSRKPRINEKNKRDYNFISEKDFIEKIKQGEFLEYVNYGGNYYGTQKSQLNSQSNLIWKIDPSRAGQIRKLINPDKLVVIYLTADDQTILERLKKRGLSKTEIDKRMQDDQKFWQEFKNNYDYVVENKPGRLDQTIKKISEIIAQS